MIEGLAGFSDTTYRSLSKIRPPLFLLQVIAKGHLLLESTLTQ